MSAILKYGKNRIENKAQNHSVNDRIAKISPLKYTRLAANFHKFVIFIGR
ncbi:hypothetical protein CAMSH0001_0415 [Campylobacter showae RM3277]|uniref:Uncharacterized protein n=1 Tax=Campylobacter showae RM3277 TaxID=553219 RepID=C6RFA9_9BACT|nr:hypothetical protein CAMSH0001_0415 [Campylobacter showae RM3277]